MATVTALGFSIISTYDGRGTTDARRSLNDLNGDLDKNNAKLKAASSSFFSLSTAAAALGPALVPVGAAIVGVGVAAGAMAVAAGTALGAYGLAMKGAIDVTLKMAKAHQALSPVQATFISSLHAMKSAMDGLSTGTMNITLHTATLVVQGLTNVIRGMTPVIKAVAPVVDSVAEAFKKWSAGDGLKRFVGIVINEGVPALKNMLDAGRNVLTFLGDGFRAFAPTIIPVSKAIDDGAKALARWGNNGGFANFLTLVTQNAPAIKGFFKALVDALANIGTAMVGLGPLSLSLTTNLLKLVAALPPSVLQAIVVAILAMRTAMLAWALASAIATAAQIALAIAASPFLLLMAGAALTILAVVAAVAALAVGLYFLVTRWQTVQAALVTAWNATWNAMKIAAMAVWTALQIAWTAFIHTMAAVWTAVSAGLSAAWRAVWAAMGVAARAVWTGLQAAWSAFCNAIRAAYNAFSAAMQASWNVFWNVIRTVANAAWAALKASWQAFFTFIRAIYNAFSAAMQASWNAFWTVIKTVANAAWTALKASWQAFFTFVRGIYNAFSSAMQSSWNAFWNVIKTVANAAWSALKSSWQAFYNFIRAIFNSFADAMKRSWNLFWGALKTATEVGVKAIKAAWELIKKIFRDPIQAVVNVVYNNGIVKLWNIVAGVFGAPKLSAFTLPNFATGGPVSGPGGPTEDKVLARLSAGEHVWTAKEVDAAGGHGAMLAMRESVMGRSYKAAAHGDGTGGFPIGGIIPNPIDIIKDVFNSVKGVASAAFSVATGFGADILKKLGGLALGAIAGPINGLIQKAADVGKSTVRGIIPGSPWTEQLIAGGATQPSGQQGAGAPGGTGMIQMIADMVKNWITQHDVSPTGGGNTAEAQKWADAQVGKPYALGGNFGTTFDCSQFMSGITQIILGKKPSPLFTTFAFTGAKQGPATFEKDLKAPFMVGVTNAGVGHMAGTLNGKNYEATPPRVRSGPGARGAGDGMFPMHYGMKASVGGGQGVIPAGQHKAIIDAALAAAHVPPPGTLAQWEAGLNTLITRESAWNSSAINKTDSNAAAGHPSQGLAQVIPSTFAAYHVAGTSSNILDPIANVAAAIRYIIARYGNITNVQQANASLPPKGYSMGTNNAVRGWHMVGEGGPEWTWFHGGEKVLPHGKRPDGEGGDHVEFHEGAFKFDLRGASKEAVQHVEGQMCDKLRMAVMAGVGKRSQH